MQTKKIWVDKGSKFYTRLMKSWSQDDDIKMYLTHIEGKSVVADRSIRTLKYKFTNILLQYQRICILMN